VTDRDPRLATLVDGLAFPEGPRWHDGELFFSDMHGHRVVRVDAQGTAHTVFDLPTQPSGLGWLPDGRMLVVSMVDRKVLRRELDGALEEHADLSHLATWHCNDMVVDGAGRAYVGNFGVDIYAPKVDFAPTVIMRVDPDGAVTVAADELWFPNGTVITPDGRTLIVGESGRGRLTAFTITPDGALTDRRLFAQLPGAVPDGICLDAEGAVWSACPMSNRVIRVAEGGELLDEIPTGRGAFACMLGGPERRTLFICTADTSEHEECARLRTGRIEYRDVDVPGAGWP
jgi:sugar lactone lactonase YvrE